MKCKLCIGLAIVIFAFSCKKEEAKPCADNSSNKEGFLILNEGLFQQNNASLSFLSSGGELTHDYFIKQNGRLLGDTGNHMIVYGGKVYVVVHASSTIEVLDKSTLKSIKQIQMHYDGQDQLPRFAVGAKGSVFISSYDGYVNVLDTSSLTITDRVQVGNNPEGITFSNDKIFVSNSGGLNSPNYDSTVSVIDVNTLNLEENIFVGANPGAICTDAEGDVYVVKRGDYSSDPSELILLDAQNAYQMTNTGVNATSLYVGENDLLWIAYFNYSSNQSKVAQFNLQSESIISANFIDASDIENLYGIYVNNDELYCFDARGFTVTGLMKVYDVNTAAFKNEYEMGLNPNCIVKIEP